MTVRDDSCLHRDTLRWLAALPFLGTEDLALLTGQPEPDIEGLLRGMTRDRLVDVITPSSPELDGTPLHVLTEPTRRLLRSALDEEAARGLPLTWRDVVQGLARIEATVAINAFASAVVASLHSSAGRQITDFRTLPVRRPQGVWWPPGVEGYGCIGSAVGAAPFFVAVDRAGTPAAHRGALMASWYRFRESEQPWGRESPPVLILCPSMTREAEWARQALASAERRDAVPLRILLTVAATSADGFGRQLWRRAEGASRPGLMDWLPVWQKDYLTLPSAPLPMPQLPIPAERRQPLHRWARDVASGASSATTIERSAAVALTSSVAEKELIECLARHPLLGAAELALVLRIDFREVRRVVERAVSHRLIVSVERQGERCRRYCLGPVGLHVLAVRDGVPVRRYARHAPVTVPPADDGDRMPTLLQQYEHTVGANSFFISWLSSRTQGGPRLASWLSAADSVIRFENGSWRRTLRPDGAGVVSVNGTRHHLLLEWDRGTERAAVLAGKLSGYAAYYQSCRMTGAPPPTLLFVTTTPQREHLVWQVAARILRGLAVHLRTTTDLLLQRRGPSAAIWQPGAGHVRILWPSAGGEQIAPSGGMQ